MCGKGAIGWRVLVGIGCVITTANLDVWEGSHWMEGTCRNWVCNNYGKPGCVGRKRFASTDSSDDSSLGLGRVRVDESVDNLTHRSCPIMPA